MIHIKDICYALIFINGQEVGNAQGFLKRLICIEGNGQFVPSFQLDFLDADSKFFSNRALTDGDIITFYIAKKEDQLETAPRRFLKIESDESYKEMPNSSIAGILDVPKYILEKGSESINGTSEDALKQIAKECELSYSGLYDYNGVTPNDKQIWRNSSNRRAVFARHIVDHAYLGDKTCPNIVVNSHRELLFRDLNVLIKTPIEEQDEPLEFTSINAHYPGFQEVSTVIKDGIAKKKANNFLKEYIMNLQKEEETLQTQKNRYEKQVKKEKRKNILIKLKKK